MKRRICLLIVAAVLAIVGQSSGGMAQAQYTISQLREQAAQGWHETYTDKYGREIIVDIETPVYLPQLVFDYLNQEEYGIGILTMKEEAVIAEDIPVCSFDQVISNLEGQIEKGYIQRVTSLRFGYAVYNNPLPANQTPRSAFDAECYYAVPSWIVECVFAVNPKKDMRNSENTRFITIDAQSGEMLDVFDKSKGGRGNADYKGFVPWDDVR